MADDEPRLTPPTKPPAFARDPRASRFNTIALVGLGVVVLAAVAVVVILPSRVADRQSVTEVPTPAPAVEEPKSTTVDEGRLETQRLLKQALERQIRAESEGAKVWGAARLVTSYPDALAALAEADAHRDGERFERAATRYRDAIGMFEQLLTSRTDRADRSVRAGAEAFAELDSKSAQRHYELALAADPERQAAKIGLERARNLPRLLESIEIAQAHETAGRLDEARLAYSEAVTIDANYAPAREHLRRVDEAIIERDYRRSISEALSALERNDLGAARTALDAARKARADAPEVGDIERRLRTTDRNAQLNYLRSQAERYENEEKWANALATYEKALGVDGSANFALRGKKRAAKHDAMVKQVREYVSNPDGLGAPEHMDHARKVLALAVANPGIGPKFRDQTVKLSELLDRYAKPVPTTFRSDEKTDVVVYTVGRLGIFLERSIMLRPGHYTALGTRSGYRDVRVEFTVKPNGDAVAIDIRCEDKA